MKKIEAKIEKLVYGGDGLARTDSGVVFIPDVLPGEIVRAVIHSDKGGKISAHVEEIVEPSPFRRAPSCIYAGVCGGCNWLHIGYEEQLRIKEEIFTECMERIGKLKTPHPRLFASPESNYRIRAQIKVGEDGSAGFFSKKSNNIVNITRCPLLAESLNELFVNGIFDLLQKGKVTNFKAIAGENGIASCPPIPKFTSDSTCIKAGGYLFEVSGSSFFQNNRFLLEKLGTWALGDVGGKTCIDLYGGTGFFSVMLAERFTEGILVESGKKQVADARRNFIKNKVGHFKAICATVEQASKLVSRGPDLLILDPPRPGLSRKALEEVAKMGAGKILYVSCNPSTQARDAAFLVGRCGYKIEKTAVFDLYPNTYHLETAMLLSV